MENQSTAHDLIGMVVAVTPPTNGSAHPPEWIPPQTRDAAERAIVDLSNDIGLILAQLAEDQTAWCGRTGRSPADYAAWRRRALFAKVHKEAQLRECKRIRSRLGNGSEPEGFVSAAELLAWCRAIVDAWLDDGVGAIGGQLGNTLARLAEYLDGMEAAGGVSRA